MVTDINFQNVALFLTEEYANLILFLLLQGVFLNWNILNNFRSVEPIGLKFGTIIEEGLPFCSLSLHAIWLLLPKLMSRKFWVQNFMSKLLFYLFRKSFSHFRAKPFRHQFVQIFAGFQNLFAAFCMPSSKLNFLAEIQAMFDRELIGQPNFLAQWLKTALKSKC